MDHFLDIEQLSVEQLEQCIQRALHFKRQKNYPTYADSNLAMLFYENSTRTRISFEMAAQHLSMPVIRLDPQSSSEQKGEHIQDTLSSLSAMGIQYFVIRHQENRLVHQLAAQSDPVTHLINAGDGSHAHPSQALLDMVTIVEEKPQLPRLKIAIVGNLRHSRVANSLQVMFKKMGVGELALIAPPIWQPETLHFGRYYQSMKEGIEDADVIVCLRIQKERLLENEGVDIESYQRDYMLTEQRISLAKPDLMIMHPGPVNRGIEIQSELVEHPRSFIRQQITNGVYARMAILESLIKEKRSL